MNVKELIAELQSKVMIELKDGQILCPDCKGLRFKYTEKDDGGFISNCTRCHNGKLKPHYVVWLIVVIFILRFLLI